MCFKSILLRKKRSTRSRSRSLGKRNQIGKMIKAELWEQWLAEQIIPRIQVTPPEQGFELTLDGQADRCEKADLKHRFMLSRKYRRKF